MAKYEVDLVLQGTIMFTLEVVPTYTERMLSAIIIQEKS